MLMLDKQTYLLAMSVYETYYLLMLYDYPVHYTYIPQSITSGHGH